MSYPWTRVPPGEPPLDSFQLRLLPIADLFMALMWSRPGGLSLRTAWVTPATLGLAIAVLLIGLPAGIVLLSSGVSTGNLLALAIGLLAVVLGAGAGSVALYGVRQRLLPRGSLQR